MGVRGDGEEGVEEVEGWRAAVAGREERLLSRRIESATLKQRVINRIDSKWGRERGQDAKVGLALVGEADCYWQTCNAPRR